MTRDAGNFVAIDFETANYDCNSACEVGLVQVVKGGIVSEHSFLIRPPTKQFVPRFTDLHGIKWGDVRHAPTFGDLWQEIQKIIEGSDFLAAHNASFDQRVLAASCEHYNISLPDISFLCSMTAARDLWAIRPTKLPDVCKALQIPSGKHHRALDDARACAKIILQAHRQGEFRRVRAAQFKRSKQLELLPKKIMRSASSRTKKLSTAERSKQLGNWGEKKVFSLLYEAGFEEIENLNDRVSNHPFADILARRNGRLFLIGVKTRNKHTAQGRLNSAYNVRKKGRDLMSLADEYKAELAWVAVQVEAEKHKFSAYFGTIGEIDDKGERFSIPMSDKHTANYECLAQSELDRSIEPAWSNRQMGKESAERPTEKIKSRTAPRSITPRISRRIKTSSQDQGDVAAETLGFRPGTKTHRAVSMYLRKQGATTQDIINVNGGPYLNCLKQVESQGHTVEKRKVSSKSGGMITSYRIVLSSRNSGSA